MNVEELAAEIARIKGVNPVPDTPGTFMNPIPFTGEKNTIHFLRPVAEDVVLKASTMNAPTERAIANAVRRFDFATAKLSQIVGNQVTRIDGYQEGEEKFDALLALGPSITHCEIAPFLKSRTTECYAINHIEFAGNETEAEAVTRKKHVRLSDRAREITPVIFARYQKQTGQRSEKYLAVAKHDYLVTLIQQMPRDGGVVELENWERARLTLTTNQGSADVEATFDKQSQKLSVDEVVKLVDALVFKSADAARELW
jgi:hypothetical protein